MARHKNGQWDLHDPVKIWDEVHAALLMDIRDELQTLNRLLGCRNFTRLPFVLDEIAKNTKKPVRGKKKAGGKS